MGEVMLQFMMLVAISLIALWTALKIIEPFVKSMLTHKYALMIELAKTRRMMNTGHTNHVFESLDLETMIMKEEENDAE